MEAALQLLVLVVCGVAGGVWVDSQTHMTPVFTVGGLALGLLAGIASIYKRYSHINADEKTERGEEDPLP